MRANSILLWNNIHPTKHFWQIYIHCISAGCKNGNVPKTLVTRCWFVLSSCDILLEEANPVPVDPHTDDLLDQVGVPDLKWRRSVERQKQYVLPIMDSYYIAGDVFKMGWMTLLINIVCLFRWSIQKLIPYYLLENGRKSHFLLRTKYTYVSLAWKINLANMIFSKQTLWLGKKLLYYQN